MKEMNRLCDLGVLEFQPASEWVSPSFIIPKNTVLQELEGFTFATALDLNMGYYTICLGPDASKIYTIIFPWEKYSYLRLPIDI